MFNRECAFLSVSISATSRKLSSRSPGLAQEERTVDGFPRLHSRAIFRLRMAGSRNRRLRPRIGHFLCGYPDTRKSDKANAEGLAKFTRSLPRAMFLKPGFPAPARHPAVSPDPIRLWISRFGYGRPDRCGVSYGETTDRNSPCSSTPRTPVPPTGVFSWEP